MPSRSSCSEHIPQTPTNKYSEDPAIQGVKTMKRGNKKNDYSLETNPVLRSPKSDTTQNGNSPKEANLSRDDLLFLLSILEGEVQARDEVIGILKAEKMDLALLEAQYGFVTPKKVLEALQRDAIQAKVAPWQEDIYEKPINELDKVVEKQKESYKRMLEQLLIIGKAHRQTILELEEEKRKHKEYVEKSDKFINLMEKEQERFKKLIDQETAYHKEREQENKKKVTALKEELTKLKSFALMVVDEQQRLTEQLTLQSKKIQDLTTTAEQAHEKVAVAEAKAQEEEHKASRLERELQRQTKELQENQGEIMAKLTNEDSQNRQLRLKLAALSRQIDELEETNRSLRKAEEELQEIREKINKGEGGNSSILAEVEELRKRVLEMEGKDEELIKMEEQCRDLHQRLENETSQSKDFKLEVDKLNKRIMDLEKLEDAFGKSKQECHALKCNLEKEKMTTKQLSQELDGLKVRIKELETIESKLEKTEFTLKEDLTKLKTLTVMLVDERKTMSEKMKQTEDKLQAVTSQLQMEQNKVTLVTEKLIEESKRALKSNTDIEEKVYSVTKERDELKIKLKAEEEKGNDLLSKVNILKKRLQSLETIEKDFLKNKSKQEMGKSTIAVHQENNKIKELSEEVERLKHKLKDMKAIEDDLMKTEDEYESLERRYANERDKAKFLSEELEDVKMELARYKLAEKTESSQEQWLFKRLKEEEVKSGHLSREVDALKEKIHEYMATEDLICHLQSDHTILQKKLNQQENRNRDLGREIESLTKELERYRHFSKNLQPSLNGRRISDLQVFSKEVQTEPADNEPPDYKSLIPLERAVINGQLYEESDNEDEDPNDNESTVSFKCNSSTAHPVNRKLWIPWMKSKEGHPQNGKIPAKQNGSYVQPGDLVLSHTPGQPLHIKVTPDHGQNTATLEITSPTTESPHSYTSTAVIPNCGTPKQRITIIQNASITPVKSKSSTDNPINLEQGTSPIAMATLARAPTPESCGSLTPERTMSPIHVLAVTGSAGSPEQGRSPEPVEVGAKHAVFRVSPERQSTWQFQRSNSNGSSVITTEDNKIHIHLGSPYMQAVASPVRPASPSTPPQDTRTPALINGTAGKATNKVTSSITITPTTTPLPRQSQITVSNIYN
ncbi:filamin A-interacting protein 1-like isoform X1 [Antechinus flavipes]|uniref:filamin A-interacting protein 1-like isoform X1 n=2 Tax=Antechinus flavipes TaxID=38775 RepID=UPI00223559AE|nr:filamin A-interacting protein 1-like isoform X1 [Antechinus flavipes]XP_051841137.1 filamin A-interacting protein 1-like isoform X1 [Antechinus flavipes]XP_051841138.1 filamin A-interacting protein 1-like isoform X1 [Antechinus flavipes]XP_051841139.1 filamin A-interacting protein 1-like isoform X1 [Antechinus flavipes]XP_051841140.1 filamin A-interacting protein 1-like isoform X1 [Antechinus flavipes]